MKLKVLKKLWSKYCEECMSTVEMDIEKHTDMASNVGFLITEVERLDNKLKLLEQVDIENKALRPYELNLIIKDDELEDFIKTCDLIIAQNKDLNLKPWALGNDLKRLAKLKIQ